jgi:hypothetical protein
MVFSGGCQCQELSRFTLQIFALCRHYLSWRALRFSHGLDVSTQAQCLSQ